jgi:hypothetical protein
MKHVEVIYACKLLVGKLEVKRSLARTRHSWKDNIKIYLEEIS